MIGRQDWLGFFDWFLFRLERAGPSWADRENRGDVWIEMEKELWMVGRRRMALYILGQYLIVSVDIRTKQACRNQWMQLIVFWNAVVALLWLIWIVVEEKNVSLSHISHSHLAWLTTWLGASYLTKTLCTHHCHRFGSRLLLAKRVQPSKSWLGERRLDGPSPSPLEFVTSLSRIQFPFWLFEARLSGCRAPF